ncbi:methylamine utilization protein [Ideonella sp. YS5]|uniref:methylamine utilization protein n=1 Tax=Ideonella sp. YS5 TaxID=3453714 RepID=UPI003EEFBE4F
MSHRLVLACSLSALLGSVSAQAATVQVLVQGEAGQALADAVLLLEPVGGKPPALKPSAQVEIAQKGRRFVPTVTVVPVGTKVQFPNQDTVRHHVYSFSPAKKFELKLYVGRPENPVEFDRAGVVVLGCNIHDTMVGWVIVSDTPWYAKTPAAGRVTLTDVPPGAYLLRSWHPDLPAGSTGVEQPVTVGAADLALTARMPVK